MGAGKQEHIDKIHLQFCKTILGVWTSTPNCMVYGELGRYPVELQIKIKILCFWNKIVGNPDKLSGKIYRLLFKLFICGNRDIHGWIILNQYLMKQVSAIYGMVKIY